jgi:hypothetical protein
VGVPLAEIVVIAMLAFITYGAYRRWTVQGSGGTRDGNLAGACLLIIVVGLAVLVLRAMF